jgi:hypothetical protein
MSACPAPDASDILQEHLASRIWHLAIWHLAIWHLAIWRLAIWRLAIWHLAFGIWHS